MSPSEKKIQAMNNGVESNGAKDILQLVSAQKHWLTSDLYFFFFWKLHLQWMWPSELKKQKDRKKQQIAYEPSTEPRFVNIKLSLNNYE